MSDPVSNAEIEDVLSSIRRLVSEDPSPLHKRKGAAETAKERFVLTPALRVQEEDAAPEDEEAEKAAAPEPAMEDGADPAEGAGEEDAAAAVPMPPAEQEERFSQSRQTLEERIAELEAALQHSPEEWEPDGSEVDASMAPDMPGVADPDDGVEVYEDLRAEMGDAVSPDAETEVWPDGNPDADDPDDAAGSETLVTEDAEPDGEAGSAAEQDAAEQAADPFAAWREDALEDDEEHAPDDDDVEAPGVAETASAEPEAAKTVAPEIADGASQIGAAARALDPDGDAEDAAEPDDAASVRDPELPDELQGPAVDLTEAETGPDDAAPDGERFGLFEEDAVVDETALREMVAQLVRDELQGVLGERITHNVRRLVRREIQRAIAMRELE